MKAPISLEISNEGYSRSGARLRSAYPAKRE